MPYVVLIDPMGKNGMPSGRPAVWNVNSEREGLDLMESAALTALVPTVISLYDHKKRMLLSYASRSRSLVPFGATPL